MAEFLQVVDDPVKRPLRRLAEEIPGRRFDRALESCMLHSNELRLVAATLINERDLENRSLQRI